MVGKFGAAMKPAVNASGREVVKGIPEFQKLNGMWKGGIQNRGKSGLRKLCRDLDRCDL